MTFDFSQGSLTGQPSTPAPTAPATGGFDFFQGSLTGQPAPNNIPKMSAFDSSKAALAQSQSKLDMLKGAQGDQTYGASFPSAPTDSPLMSGAKGLGNVPSSSLNLLKNLFSAAAHPINTVQNIGGTIAGAASEAGRVIGSGANVGKPATPEEQQFDSLKTALYNRYGTLANFQKTAVNDPMGTGSDIVGILEGGAGLAGKTEELNSALSKVASPIAAPISDITGKAADFVANAVGEKAGNMADAIEKTNLRLTPVQKTNLGSKLNDIIDYITSNKITGTPEARLEKVNGLYQATEDQLESFLKNDAKDVTVPKQSVLDSLENLKSSYQNERDVLPIESQIDGLKKTIETKYPDQIPVDRLNQLKRSTFSNAYNQAGTKVLDSVEHDMGDVLYNHIKDATSGMGIGPAGKSLEEFNKEYSTLINSRKLLKIAAGRPQIGLIGKLISTAVGGMIGSVGGLPGEIAGTMMGPKAGELLAGTGVKSTIASGLKALAK